MFWCLRKNLGILHEKKKITHANKSPKFAVLADLMRYIHKSQVKKPLILLPQFICKKPDWKMGPRVSSPLLGEHGRGPLTQPYPRHPASGISGLFSVG